MIIQAIIENANGERGIANFICDIFYDFKFIVTSDPYVQLVDYEQISWAETIRSDYRLIFANAYRAENECVGHDRYPLAEICNAQGIRD